MGKRSRYSQLSLSSGARQNRRKRPSLWTMEKDASGATRLLIEFQTPEESHSLQSLDATDWIRWPKLFPIFCSVCASHYARRRPNTRREVLKDLTRGWFNFLEERRRFEIEVHDIDRALVHDFVAWLDRQNIAEVTRVARFGVFRTVMRGIKQSSEFGHLVAADFHTLRGPWRGAQKKAVPTRVLSEPAWQDVYVACVDEVESIMKAVSDDWRAIALGRKKLASLIPTSQSSYSDVSTCLAELDRTFPAIIPARPEIFAANSHLDNGILKYHGYTRVARPFHPRPRLLVPFVLLLGMQLNANGSLLLGATRSDFSTVEFFGGKRIVWRRFKPRARTTQKRSFAISNDSDNPHRLLTFLEQWTARIRAVAPIQFRDRIFLFVPEWGEAKRCMSFAVDHSGACAWTANLKRFIRDHSLAHLNLRMIRASGIDQVRSAFDGDETAVGAAGNQKTSSTLRRSYFSSGARAVAAEQVGGIIELRTRMLVTKGKVDPRRVPNGTDRSAATPGWTCLDPFDSPIPGQQPGRLCHAYGACPVCPLARQDYTSSYALARALQLREAIKKAVTITPAERWIAVWKPVLRSLEKKWLLRFTQRSVLSEAAKLSLEPLPMLE